MLNHSCELVDLILVGCVKSKRHRAGPARDVYTSTLWQYRQAFAELHGCPWYILSAKHGLLAPGTWRLSDMICRWPICPPLGVVSGRYEF